MRDDSDGLTREWTSLITFTTTHQWQYYSSTNLS